MKRAFIVLMLAALAGCASNQRPPVVPSLEGKPRVQINQQAPAESATETEKEGE